MTTSMMPTHGDPLRHDPLDFMDSDPERWLPDPSWPVPPRGWQLWAAAGPAARSRVARGAASLTSAGTVLGHTDGVTSDQSRCAVLEDTSFTLPTRPALDRCETVDLLADLPRRRLPEGTVPGFAILGGLVIFSSLVGGLTGGLVVTGVSTLLAASAALVRGRVTLAQVGGPRGAGLLLGVAVTALIVGTVATHERSSRLPSVPAAPMPASSPRVSQAQTSYAAVPPSGVDASVPSPSPTATSTTARAATAATAPETASSTASPRPSATASTAAGSPDAAAGSPEAGGGLTLSPDVLSPKPITANDPKDDTGAKDPKAAKADKDAKAAKAAKDKGRAEPKGPAGLIEVSTGKAGKTGKAKPGNDPGTTKPGMPGTAAGAARSVVAR